MKLCSFGKVGCACRATRPSAMGAGELLTSEVIFPEHLQGNHARTKKSRAAWSDHVPARTSIPCIIVSRGRISACARNVDRRRIDTSLYPRGLNGWINYQRCPQAVEPADLLSATTCLEVTIDSIMAADNRRHYKSPDDALYLDTPAGEAGSRVEENCLLAWQSSRYQIFEVATRR
jgi:hypothetical protein